MKKFCLFILLCNFFMINTVFANDTVNQDEKTYSSYELPENETSLKQLDSAMRPEMVGKRWVYDYESKDSTTKTESNDLKSNIKDFSNALE